MPKKTCTSEQIRNPKTGRCVLRKGKVGQKVLQARRKKKSSLKKLKPCKSGQIRNPKTNRCVKRSGELGKKVVKKQQKRKKKKSAKKIQVKVGTKQKLIYDTLKHELNIPESSVQQIDYLNEGGFGTVYSVYFKDQDGKPVHTPIIAKMVKLSKDSKPYILHEFKTHKEMYDAKLPVPKPILIRLYDNKKKAVILMELEEHSSKVGLFEQILKKRLDDGLLETIGNIIFDLLTQLCSAGFIHGDFHWGNIGFQHFSNYDRALSVDSGVGFTKYKLYYNNELVEVAPFLIDFGWSVKNTCYPQLEVAQLIRTLHWKSNGKYTIHKYNRQFLHDYILKKLFSEDGILLSQKLPQYHKMKMKDAINTATEEYEKHTDKMMDVVGERAHLDRGKLKTGYKAKVDQVPNRVRFAVKKE